MGQAVDRRGCYPPIDAAYENGTTKQVWITIERARNIASLHGGKGVKQLAYSVPEVLKSPTALFRGTREGSPHWLCYCGIPSRWFAGESEAEVPFPPNRVLVVFVNGRDELYTFGPEECDLDEPTLPKDHDDAGKFQHRVRL